MFDCDRRKIRHVRYKTGAALELQYPMKQTLVWGAEMKHGSSIGRCYEMRRGWGASDLVVGVLTSRWPTIAISTWTLHRYLLSLPTPNGTEPHHTNIKNQNKRVQTWAGFAHRIIRDYSSLPLFHVDILFGVPWTIRIVHAVTKRARLY